MACITTVSGVEFDFANPTPDMINIGDIAHALDRICRFNGHYVGPHYSVATHSVGVCAMVDEPELKLAALLHDATEAYIGDITTPLKSMLTEIHGIERSILKAVAEKFNFSFRDFAEWEIKKADLRMLYAERQLFIPQNQTHWPCFDILEGVYRFDAAKRFLDNPDKPSFLEVFHAYERR